MPKNDHDKRKSGGVLVADAPAPAATTDAAQPESLDKVRDILFGGQMRAVDSRLQGLEERLRSDHDALRADFVKQVESLDAFIRSEVQLLGERLAAERAKRTEELKSLAAEIKDTIRALEKRHVKLEEATNLADAGLRDQLLIQAERASTELTRLGEKLTAELKRSHHELKSTKPDSAALSGLLSELAARVGSLAAPPAKNGPRG
jgi:DNA repair exonuclease SbcCD ATPase subunit